MRLLWTTTLFLMLFGCSESSDRIAKNTVVNLNSTLNVSYHIDYLTIEGRSVGDTIFTTTYAFFEKSETDTLLGYNFLIESSLIHPRFLIPIVLRDHYNGTELTWTLESQVRSDVVEPVNCKFPQQKGFMSNSLNEKTSKFSDCTHTTVKKDFTTIQKKSKLIIQSHIIRLQTLMSDMNCFRNCVSLFQQ